MTREEEWGAHAARARIAHGHSACKEWGVCHLPPDPEAGAGAAPLFARGYRAIMDPERKACPALLPREAADLVTVFDLAQTDEIGGAA